MCGRYSNVTEFSELKLAFRIDQVRLLRDVTPTFNIAPSRGAGHEPLFIGADHEGRRELRQGRWGLIPDFWTAPLAKLPSTFNARSEDLMRRPLFRKAFQEQRCLVPATGWREFRGERGDKQPFQFEPREELAGPASFAFAGLWSSWRSADGELVDSFTILTTAPSPAAAAIHDRMPLVLPLAEYDAWLGPANDPPATLARAQARSSSLPLSIRPTQRIGNDPRFEGPEVLADYDPTGRPASQLSLFEGAPRKAKADRLTAKRRS